MGTSFGQRLRELRDAKKLTQAQLASLCGLGESTVSFYEGGKREPNYKILLTLAEALSTTPNYLLVGIESHEDIDWWGKNKTPPSIELDKFILEHRNLRIFGEPLKEEAKGDILLALQSAWEVLKQNRAKKHT